ncbi:UvrD-helicase domain-containing protein [Methylomarinum sp. Ch1-1]|uniref:DNA 3'-5' helicase n=1 Tax=Methylomarinum roseum TaxID=3067653 RepID=A0AAU7NTZ9_9GAMM|nr:UvrD-helicase domain-containing protein [Methylomarinum sp. Ch1-1]MDP4519446.1 UvrD-helicase domain-containing protein [Methylomarinum sp. Ch1-1]
MESSKILFNYRIGRLAALFAAHCDYQSFAISDDGILLFGRDNARDKISHLSIGRGGALEPGYFWDVLEIHLENGDLIRIGGINKKQSSRFLVGLNKTYRAYLRDFYQGLAPQIQAASEQARGLLSGRRYIRRGLARQWLNTYQDLADGIQRKDVQRFLPSEAGQQLQSIRPLLNHGLAVIEQVNESYVARQLEVFQQFFDQIESKPLTPNQRRACVIDEQHNLVLAGAGTGKTSTMIGRAGYLLNAGLAQPEQILMLAFARKAADEMEERIQDKLGIDSLTVKTFHGLGKHIIAQVEGKASAINTLAEDDHLRARFVDEQLQRLLKDELYQSRFVNYVVRFRYRYSSVFHFNSQGEYNDYILENDIRTLQGELVKSYEECEIANFLYRQGIAYQYEANYQVNTSGPDFRVYQPDFYLPEYGIYIEHFAVNEHNQTPPFIDQEKYLDGMEWKRELHQKHRTHLIETYSYQKQQGVLTEALQQRLKAAGVTFRPLSNHELLDQLNRLGQVSSLGQLLAQMLALFKAACQSIKGMVTLARQHEDSERMQAAAFLFEPIYEAYQQYLKDTDSIDFDDMIGRAIEYVEAAHYCSPYRYILVDEFQDISASRTRLIKALLSQNPDNGLFCVGDDWQSIYRFTGSDVSITKEFEEHFGATTTSVLDQTFRFNNKIGEVASRFVMQNPTQIDKQILSHRIIEQAAVSLIKTQHDQVGLNAALSAINSQAEEHASVLILARFKFRKPDLSALQRQYAKLKLQFMTVHGSKGKEADYVIVLGLEKGRHGFPSEQSTHPLLELLLPKAESFAHAEERRLFYVALTRARHHVYLISDANKASDFVRELVDQRYDIHSEEFSGEGFQHKIADIVCGECETGYMAPRDGKHGNFFACSGYPLCSHTESACQRCGGALKENGRFRVCENKGCDYVEPACPKCGGKMSQRKGPYGQFWGCSNYRKGADFSCAHTEQFIDLQAAKHNYAPDDRYIS